MKKLNLLVSILLFLSMSCTNDDEPIKSSEKSIMAFSFLDRDNEALAIDINANIDQEKRTIDIELPEGTLRTSLVPVVTISNKASVTPADKISIDFSQPVIYTVTAEDKSTQDYMVTVTVKKSSEKKVESFVFLASNNGALDKDFIAVVDEGSKTIAVTMPYHTNLTGLKPTLVISDGATVVPSTETTIDFSSPVTYTVTAADLSTQDYKVTINTPITDRDVLIDWYNRNPNNTVTWDFSKPIGEWEGIELKDGRVFSILLNQKSLPTITPLIGHLSELRSLSVVNDNIIQVPKSIGNLENLQSLDFTGNGITKLPDEIGKLEKLTLLKLHNNKLTSLFKGIDQLQVLIELDLTFNDIQSLPVEIGLLTKLEAFSVYGNRNLKTIPAEIGNLTNLRYLNLGYCDLENIPMEIGNLTKLVELRVDENRLTTIPTSLGNLSSIVSLKLQKNLLTSLPRELGMLNNLVEFNIQENQIMVIPKEICDLNSESFILLKDSQATCE